MLTDIDKAKLAEFAKAEGLDPAKLVAAAERLEAGGATPGGGAPVPGGKANEPKLYMYLLPFVTVAEVRRNFLGLTEPFPGDSKVASDWAREHPSASPTDASPGGPAE